MEAEYASKAQGNTATTLGAIGTALGVMNIHGGLGGLFGNGAGFYGNGGMYAATNTAAALAINSEKDAKIARLEAEKYADKNTVEVYNALAKADKEINIKVDDLKGRVLAIETAAPLREQILNQKIDGVAFAANAGIRALQETVGSITKLIVPKSAVCPEPMARYNSWTAPVTETAPVTPVANA